MQERENVRVYVCVRSHVCLIHEGQTKAICCLILYPCIGATNKVTHAHGWLPEKRTCAIFPLSHIYFGSYRHISTHTVHLTFKLYTA